MLSPEAIIDTIIEGYVQVDAELRIRFMNGPAERLMRRSKAEAVGQLYTDVATDAAKSHQWPQIVEAIQQHRAIELAVFYPTQYVWHEMKTVPTKDGGAAFFIRDVTDRQWLVRREAERSYLKNVFETAPVAITIMRGPKHIIEYVNAFGRQLVGGRALEGKPIRDALPDLKEKELFDVIERVYAEGTSFEGKDVHVTFDRNGDGVAEEGWFDVSYQPARDFDGKVSGVLSLSIDVTDRIRRSTDKG